jgi:hypothetical protein
MTNIDVKPGPLSAEMVPLLTAGRSVLFHRCFGVATWEPTDDAGLTGPWFYIGERGDDGWISWSGGPNPVPGKLVDTRFRGDPLSEGNSDPSGMWTWEHDGDDGDIIAFRLVEADKGSSADAEWMLMPRDASERMMDAGVAALHAAEPNIDGLPGYCALRAAYDAMIANASEPPSVPGEGHGTGVVGWQPIETAPRDGSGFIVTCPYVQDGVSMMMWDNKLNSLVSLFDGKPWVANFKRPTHWMPLPPPPAASVSMGTSRKASEPKAAVEGVNAELLEALETVLAALDVSRATSGLKPDDYPDFEAWESQARAAIQKATATRNSGDEG